MKLLNRLTFKNIKLNKRRTMVIVVAIMLSTALLTAVMAMASSLSESLIIRQKEKNGDFHVAVYNVDNSDVDFMRNNRYVTSSFEMKALGYAKLDGCINKDKPYLYVEALDENDYVKAGVNLVSGRPAKDDTELVISNHIKGNGGVTYNIGDKVTLDIGSRMNDGYEQFQNSSYLDEEELQVKYTKTYTVVGICERLCYGEEERSAPGYTVLTSTNNSSNSSQDNLLNKSNIYMTFNKEGLKDVDGIVADMINVDSNLYKTAQNNYRAMSDNDWQKLKEQMKDRYIYVNSWLVRYQTIDFANTNISFVNSMSAIAMIIIVLTAVFCISNSFAISITQRTKQYGMLASVGATPAQIRRNVFFEAIVIGIPGIALGIASGLLACYILVIVANKLIAENFEMTIVFSPSLIGVLIAIVLAIITILLSALKPAMRASKMSPIVAISHSEDIQLKQKTLKTPKYIKKCFGEGGIIAYKNMKRNKKKYRVVIISIVVSMTVFIAMNTFVGLMIDSVDYYASDDRFDLSIYLSNKVAQEGDNYYSQIKNDINNVTNITRYSLVKSIQIYFPSKPNYTEEYQKYFFVDEEDDNTEEREYYINLVSVGDEEYERYIDELGLDKEKAKKGGILYNKIKVYEEQEEKSYDIYTYSESDMISYVVQGIDNIKDNDADDYTDNIEIVAVTDKLPFAVSGGYSGSGMLIVSDEYLNKYNDYIYRANMCINCDDADKAQQMLINDYSMESSSIYNRSADKRQSDGLIMMFSIFLYGFIIVVSLIGITNIFNTITTFIEFRSREFAMLRCVGMTKNEFNRMVALESLFYGGKAGVIGILLGTVLSYVIYYYMGTTEIKYNLPIVAIVICVVAVGALLLGITRYSLRQMDKKNIIETLRNENV